MTHERALIILCLANGHSADEARSAYRREAQKWHPDKHHSAGAEQAALAAEQMKEINAAYDLLNDKTSWEDEPTYVNFDVKAKVSNPFSDEAAYDFNTNKTGYSPSHKVYEQPKNSTTKFPYFTIIWLVVMVVRALVGTTTNEPTVSPQSQLKPSTSTQQTTVPRSQYEYATPSLRNYTGESEELKSGYVDSSL